VLVQIGLAGCPTPSLFPKGRESQTPARIAVSSHLLHVKACSEFVTSAAMHFMFDIKPMWSYFCAVNIRQVGPINLRIVGENFMRPTKRAMLFCVTACFVLSSPVIADKPDWQKHIDWAIGNHTSDPGQTNCPEQYAATEPHCMTDGGRACLMTKAIDSAKHNNCGYAFRLTLITQCHNQDAQAALASAGTQAVCTYEATK
jgi:hypothetical protein